jgi:hypothetical protein
MVIPEALTHGCASAAARTAWSDAGAQNGLNVAEGRSVNRNVRQRLERHLFAGVFEMDVGNRMTLLRPDPYDWGVEVIGVGEKVEPDLLAILAHFPYPPVVAKQREVEEGAVGPYL